MADFIALREYDHLLPDGTRKRLRIAIECPFKAREEPDSEWSCRVLLPDDPKPRLVHGIDSWQAINLAMRLAEHLIAAGFLERGEILYYPDSDDFHTLQDFQQTHSGRIS